jgi:hypothetical protein
VFHRLTEPAKEILAQKYQHANLLVSASQHALINNEIFFVGIDHALQCQCRADAGKRIFGGAAAEWVEDQGGDGEDFRHSS